MRAINLIPADERRGAGGAAGRSGGAVYLLLGLLATLVVIAGLWVVSGNQVDDRRAELAEVRGQAAAATRQAAGLAQYTAFASLAERRVETVRSLSAGRFDWSETMRELARVLPADVALSALDGTSPSASGAAPGAPAVPAAGVPGVPGVAGGAPTAQLTGCTTGQKAVAILMSRLRTVDGVARVDLQSSQKSAAGGADGAVCPGAKPPTFALTLTFGAPAPPVAPPAATETGATP